jgi:chromosomal replication initiator protein
VVRGDGRKGNEMKNTDIFKTVEAAVRLRDELDSQIATLRALVNQPSRFMALDRALILPIVTNHYKLTEAELLGNSRPEHIVWPRHVACYLLRKFTDMSLVEIGKAMGGRDHGSVMNAISRVKDAMETDKAKRQQVEALCAELAKN